MELLLVFFAIACQIVIVSTTVAPKIVDGFTCHPIDYPYLISLATINRGYFCGGSLLNKFHVLTAGHCCDYSSVKEQIRVFAGTSRKRDYIQTAKVWQRHIHPTLDVCVLRLHTPIRQTSYTKFIKLATAEVFNSLMNNKECEQCITLGFGSTAISYHQFYRWAVSERPKMKLQCVYQKILKDCWEGHGILCVVGSHRPTQDACLGDSGGPLICKGIQVGLVSSGRGCGRGHASFYVRIDAVYNFIEETSQGGKKSTNLSDYVLILIYLCACIY